jgi:phosphoribosylglycinamide formyltransferase-1
MRVGILISGFGSNMIKLIESCEKENTKASINIVISNNPNAKGLEYAKSKGIRAHSIDHRLFNDRKKFDEAVNEILTNNNIDFICNAGFMRIHGEDFVKNWFNKHLNIHPSLLPSFKGLNTHQRAIDQGVKFSGCTVHMVRSGVDEGPIISQAITSVNSDDNTKLLSERILNLEHRIYPLCLQLFAEDLVSINQDKVIYTKKALEMLSEFKV